MTRLRTHNHAWLWFVVIAFALTRLSGAHLHLCFDGSEPPAAVHMVDGAVHDDVHHQETRHVDQDLNVFDALLTKKDDSSTELIAIPAAALLLLYVPALLTERVRPVSSLAIRPSPFRLRPPLRGPPL